ncbi:probable LRR receptor-like serine threonine-kinase At4g31250 [Olea europaea subsp. europaea]|uniref:Probable LRR receptor-like serine threonine-kinase At4g31250 n=1 Tax=Olea europaea subsp. europaea TaxID=158383 RepID=A0A8S0RVR3_OLEEU|nr:probable LRR receptor-like serine threonine-kinase At4g31250 [Olea europaea subsp. europaea]
MNNNFGGPFPGDLKKLEKLRGLNLANNRFSGEIPNDVFSGMKSLRRVVMGNNEFTSKIPMSLLELPKLVALQLQNNQFDGRIPDFWQENLTVNFANNKLEGPIPTTLRSQDESSFSASFIFCRRAKPQEHKKSAEIYKKKELSNSKGEITKDNEQGDLYFVRNDRERFELEELLRASSDVLGIGSFGSSYKAVLFSGQRLVVKRFKEMSSLRKEEFYKHVRRLGRLSHPNLLPLVAFYYTKEEKLLITEFAEQGSLASLLHSVAKGLAYLYKELPNITLPHGHLKSSNVLLNYTYEPLLADYGLAPVINKEHAQQFMGEESADLAAWIKSVVKEEWTGEVFDKEMNPTQNDESQMMRLLKIGMCCCEWDVEKRWDLNEAVEKIEELKERDWDDGFSSNASEGDVYT